MAVVNSVLQQRRVGVNVPEAMPPVRPTTFMMNGWSAKAGLVKKDGERMWAAKNMQRKK